MFIDIPSDYIAQWHSIEDVLPYPQYKSGAKDNDKPVYQNPLDSSSNPILALEFDILNKDGFGLKRGYYEIAVNPDYTYLMFIEKGEIKAKIPVIYSGLINEHGTDYEWKDEKNKSAPIDATNNIEEGVLVASKKIYKIPYTEKELKRRKKKYQKGQDPSLYFHSKAYMEYDEELNLYKVIFEKYNTKIIGVIKI